MTSPIDHLSRFDVLVLARLSVPRPPKQGDIAKSLRALVGPAMTVGQWRERQTALLDSLRARSLVEGMRLTESGARALCEQLGVAKLPRWAVIRDHFLPTLAIGDKGETTGEALPVAIAADQLRVPRQRTWSQLLDQVVALELGLPAGKITIDLIRVHLLARRAGLQPRGRADEVVKRIAATAVHAPNASARALRPALVRRWLGADGSVAAGIDARPPAAFPTSPPPTDDGLFVQLVADALRTIGPEGRYGPHKVFISAIWRQIRHDQRRDGMTLPDLKRRLVEANRAGTFSLARADLVGAMDRSEVTESEISDLGSTFHFVVDRAPLT
jgi:hypothetical protein